MTERIAVIGAGQMGNGIAHVFAQSGYAVTMIDVSAEIVDKGRATIAANLDRQIRKGALQAADKDATMIRFFRALLREHKVSSELWAKMISLYGRQRTIECIALMGDYFIVGTMMNAADQHLPATRQALLPPLTKQ